MAGYNSKPKKKRMPMNQPQKRSKKPAMSRKGRKPTRGNPY